MEIKINDSALDVSLENEITLGEVLTGIEQWLTNAGHRIASINIDGQSITASMIEDVFNKNIKEIKNLDIHTNVIAELCASSLLALDDDIDEYEKLSYEDKSHFFEKWKTRAQAQFLSEEMPDIYAYCVNTFSQGEMTTQVLRSILEEIQREVTTPVSEFTNIKPVIDEICERLIRLPLDIQTGKDALAAQSIQLFTAVTEKIFRVFRQLNMQGYLTAETGDEEKPLNTQIGEFSNVLKELLAAYEKNDTVLVGDITEYEASPRLKEIYETILHNLKETGDKC